MQNSQFLTEPSDTSPHFDDEQTVLSARPVVPLSEVKSNQRRRRILILVGAFAAAMILGAFVALVTVSLRTSPTEVTEEQNTAVPEPVAEATPDISQPPTKTEEPQTEAVVAPLKIPVTLAVKPKSNAESNAAIRPVKKPEASTDSKRNDVEDEITAPKPILVDEFQERRPRRVTRRQRLQNRAHRRNLLKIDEIFEGRRPRG